MLKQAHLARSGLAPAGLVAAGLAPAGVSMRALAALWLGWVALASGASAQSLDELNARSDVTAPEAGAVELDELDALSRRADDPFPEIAGRADRHPVNVTIRALNKVTAKYRDITIDMDASARFGTLEIVARHCDKRPPEEFPETTAFLQIFDRGYDPSTLRASKQPDLGAQHAGVGDPGKIANAETTGGPITYDVADLSAASHSDGGAAAGPSAGGTAADGSVFSGWMFASSPALNPLEHPVYDVWVIDCQTAADDTP